MLRTMLGDGGGWIQWYAHVWMQGHLQRLDADTCAVVMARASTRSWD